MIDRAAVLKDMAQSGPITPSRLVAEASTEGHPLHTYFIWDDTRAAHEFRLIQARQFIISVSVRPEGSRRPIPLFVHVPAKSGEGVYVLTEFVVHQPKQWELSRDEALRYLKGAEENISAMSEAMRVYGKTPPRKLKDASSLVRQARTKLART